MRTADCTKLGMGFQEVNVPKLIAPTAAVKGRVVEVAAGDSWGLLLNEHGEVAMLY